MATTTQCCSPHCAEPTASLPARVAGMTGTAEYTPLPAVLSEEEEWDETAAADRQQSGLPSPVHGNELYEHPAGLPVASVLCMLLFFALGFLLGTVSPLWAPQSLWRHSSQTTSPTLSDTFSLFRLAIPPSSLFLARLPSAVPVSSGAAPLLSVSVFYNAFIAHRFPKWRLLLSAQLQNLVDNGLAAECALIVVCLSSDLDDANGPSKSSGVFTEATALVRTILPHALIFPAAANTFEYPGLFQMWQAGQFLARAELEPDRHLMLYFHSKGMVHGGEAARSREESELFERIIDPWRHVLHMFAVRPDIDRLGLSANMQMVWVNFFWARASVIARLVQPIVYQEHRFYFEHWLGAYNASLANISTSDPRITYSPGMTLTDDGSVHLTGCETTVSVMCKNATHPQFYVVGQCVGVEQMMSWQQAEGWVEENRPVCDCARFECGLLDNFA